MPQVESVDEKDVSRSPAPPFMTSTLQQEAFNRLDFSPSSTMQAAQQLYEGPDSAGGKFSFLFQPLALCLTVHALTHGHKCVVQPGETPMVRCVRQCV